MRAILKYFLILVAAFLLGMLLFVSVIKIKELQLVNAQPDLFEKTFFQFLYQKNQWLAYLHLFTGLIFLITGAYQFIPFFRNNFWSIHRIVGKIFLICSLFLSTSALLLGIFFPFGNWMETLTTIGFGGFLLLGTYKAFVHAVQREFKDHRNWVLRVYFVSLSVASIRIITALLMLYTGKQLQDVLGISFLLALCIHLFVVEFWIRIDHPKLK